MAAVIGLRGMERGDNFELATNVTNAGNFDDLVYTVGGRRYYLQLKHTENPDTTYLQPKDMVKLLHKCFESYYEMEDKDKSDFIIYTNKRLGRMLSSHERNDTAVSTVESVFKTSTEGEIFNFTRDNNKKIDVYSGVEKLVEESKEFKNLSVPERNDKVGMINGFLGKLIMVIGQKGQLKLDKVIYKEIKKTDQIKIGRGVHEQVIRYFKMRLESWWRNKNGTVTPETLRNWLQEAKTKACAPVITSLFKSCIKTLVGTGMKFSDSEVSGFQTELSNNHVVHLRSDALTLCSILLLDCLDTSKCIFVTFESLQNNKNILLYAWLGGHWEWLIVFCDSTVQQSDISSTCLEISEIIKHDPSSKRVVILTACNVQNVGDFVPIEREFKFEQLSNVSQEIVLDKKIDFQGCEVTLRSLLQRHGNVQHVLGPELVTDLITEGTAVNIGGRLQVNDGYYAPRVLNKNIFLHSNVLQDTNDVFAVSGTRMEDLLEIIPSGKTVECISGENINSNDFTQDIRGKILLLSDHDGKSYFLAICEKLEGKTLHWVEFKNGYLLWKMSQGDTDSLLDYIDADKPHAERRTITEFMKHGNSEVNEEAICNLGERTVLVVAEPGMGKSSTTTQVAWHTKLADPTSWVVRINWNDHTRKLEEINAATFNFESLVEFLCSAAFPKLKYTDIERILFEQALQYCGKVTVLMDGFDEICPTHAHKAAVILSELMKTKVERVWVTSRPVQKEKLEKQLCVTAFSLKGLSSYSQTEMLSNLWKLKAGSNKFILSWFLTRVNHSVNADFTGCPLYITMIATVYEKDREMLLNSKGRLLPKIDLVNMYEVFVDLKLFIYLTEKQKANETNSSVLDDYKYLKQTYLENFEKCALVEILPPPILKSLHNKNIQEEIQPFLVQLQAGEEKRGIVMNVVDGKPQFVHRTFAEYFTARWFSRNFKENRSVLEHILFDFIYRMIKDMFDRMLAKDCALHCALIEGNKETVNTLLEEGCDLNVLDKGGRTFMHVIAIRGSPYWDEISQNFNYKAFLNNTDSVLQWTPLQYATNFDNWSIVERLLESNVDRSGLDIIRQRAQDQDYIYTIIRDAAREGHVLLLEFLASIGVDIDQEISRSLPSSLHAAIFLKQQKVVKWLIKKGADCNTRYSEGHTPLHFAVTVRSLDVVRALVEGGASLAIRDDKGRTVIDLAEELASFPKYQNMGDIKEIVQYLQEICNVSSSVQKNINT